MKLSPRNQLYFLTLVHTVVDSYATVLPHLLPLLLNKLVSQTARRNSLAGLLVFVFSFCSSIGQILFGWLADRARTVHFLTLGVMLSAVCLSLLGLAPTLFLAMGLLGAGGVGVAAFHPQATAQAAALSRRSRGFGVSLFLTGGNVGRALGPLLIMLLLYRNGLAWMAWCMVPGVLISLLVPKLLRSSHGEMAVISSASILHDKRKSLWQAARPHLPVLLVLYLIAVLRTVTTVGLENFLSLYLDERQYENLARSGVIALFIFAGSVGIMIGGSLSDRANRHRLLLVSLLAAPPLLYASLHSEGPLFLIFLFFGNLTLSSSITVNIVWAQQLLPTRQNIASSLMMGAAWGIGGILNIPVGILGDQYGLPAVLDGLVLLPIAAAILIIFLKHVDTV